MYVCEYISPASGITTGVIVDAKRVIAPALAYRIVMEAAVAMSKVDPRVIGFDLDAKLATD